MIVSEDDVRAWVRSASGGKARWVEPALGSTPGLPDCWVPIGLGDRQVHLELKAANLRDGVLRYDVRPEQRKQILSMVDDKVSVGFLVGIKSTRTILFLKPAPQVLNGIWSLMDENMFRNRFECSLDDVCSFWSGVNFIFLDSGS